MSYLKEIAKRMRLRETAEFQNLDSTPKVDEYIRLHRGCLDSAMESAESEMNFYKGMNPEKYDSWYKIHDEICKRRFNPEPEKVTRISGTIEPHIPAEKKDFRKPVFCGIGPSQIKIIEREYVPCPQVSNSWEDKPTPKKKYRKPEEQKNLLKKCGECGDWARARITYRGSPRNVCNPCGDRLLKLEGKLAENNPVFQAPKKSASEVFDVEHKRGLCPSPVSEKMINRALKNARRRNG
jgi:hypothetical protein